MTPDRALAEEIYQEGLRIPPIKLISAGTANRDVWDLVLLNVRTPDEREGDLRAMLGRIGPVSAV